MPSKLLLQSPACLESTLPFLRACRPFLLHYPRDRVAVIDDVCMTHPHQAQQKQGEVKQAAAGLNRLMLLCWNQHRQCSPGAAPLVGLPTCKARHLCRVQSTRHWPSWFPMTPGRRRRGETPSTTTIPVVSGRTSSKAAAKQAGGWGSGQHGTTPLLVTCAWPVSQRYAGRAALPWCRDGGTGIRVSPDRNPRLRGKGGGR